MFMLENLNVVGDGVLANRIFVNVGKTSYMIVPSKKFAKKELALSSKIMVKTNSIIFVAVTIDGGQFQC